MHVQVLILRVMPNRAIGVEEHRAIYMKPIYFVVVVAVEYLSAAAADVVCPDFVVHVSPPREASISK